MIRKQHAAGHRLHAAGGEIAGGEAGKFHRAVRPLEREIGRGGLVISTEMITATERSAPGALGPAGLEAVAAAPPASASTPRLLWKDPTA